MVFGLPFGISFLGTAFSEPKLIKLASGFEAATQARSKNLPTFAPTTPSNNISGTTPVPPKRRSDRHDFKGEDKAERPRRL